VAYSGKGASKPTPASACPFISFFFFSLWADSQGPDLGLPAVSLQKTIPIDIHGMKRLPKGPRFLPHHAKIARGGPLRATR
jgi:hypothetical protein